MALVGALGPIVFLGGLGTANTFHSINKTNKTGYTRHRVISTTDLVEGTGPDLIELTLDMHFHGPYTLAPSLGITALETVMSMRIPLPLIIGRVPVGRGIFTLFVIEAVDSRMTTFVGSGLAVADVSVKLLEYPNPLGSTGPLSALGGGLPGLSNIVGGLTSIAGVANQVAGIAGAIPGLGGVASAVTGVTSGIGNAVGVASAASNVFSSVTGGILGANSVASSVSSMVTNLAAGGVTGVIKATASQLQGAISSLTAAGKAVAGTIPLPKA